MTACSRPRTLNPVLGGRAEPRALRSPGDAGQAGGPPPTPHSARSSPEPKPLGRASSLASRCECQQGARVTTVLCTETCLQWEAGTDTCGTQAAMRLPPRIAARTPGETPSPLRPEVWTSGPRHGPPSLSSLSHTAKEKGRLPAHRWAFLQQTLLEAWLPAAQLQHQSFC